MRAFTKSNQQKKLQSKANKHSKAIEKAIVVCAISVVTTLSFNYGALADNSASEDKMELINDHALYTMNIGVGEFTNKRLLLSIYQSTRKDLVLFH